MQSYTGGQAEAEITRLRGAVSGQTIAAGALDYGRTEVNCLAFAVGFYFSFRQAIVLLSVNLLGLAPSTGSAVSLCIDLLLLGLVSFDSVGATRRSLGSLLRQPTIRWVFVFLAFSGISLAWSGTVSLPDSFAYWLGLAMDVATVTLLLRSGTLVNESHSLMKGFIWSACCLALIAWIMPAPADLRLGDEQFFNANEIGNLCAFALFFAQYLTRCRDGKWGWAKGFLLVTLIRSLSKATLGAFVASECVLLISDRSMSRKAKTYLLTAALLLVLVFWGLFVAYYNVYTTAGNQAETLTGRTAIWLYALNAIKDHPWTPWIGHGFDSWWKVVPPFGGELFEARHAENELLQQVYAYGLVGAVMLIGLYGSLYRQLRKLQPGPTRLLFLCLLLFIVIRGLAEADAFDLLLPLWSMVMISGLAGYERSLAEEAATAVTGKQRQAYRPPGSAGSAQPAPAP